MAGSKVARQQQPSWRLLIITQAHIEQEINQLGSAETHSPEFDLHCGLRNQRNDRSCARPILSWTAVVIFLAENKAEAHQGVYNYKLKEVMIDADTVPQHGENAIVADTDCVEFCHSGLLSLGRVDRSKPEVIVVF